ncbi:aspartate racemase [Hoeflea sp. IMCC20628]|uniref:aspartate/glutamate racemase family protein n=1 Tax=Hoeflea sp. IMCC20628 TaxID=1620421 RepID=UPI00063AC6E4|nr:amino acid racemase [Hoeflea sp. IMCC20628]AKI03104.1 aspartate racemase [Hoeflea sp. IMCC20628]
MNLIGLLGGINGWKTTATYYRLMNEYARKQLGDDHTARVLLHSVNYQQIREYRANDDWGSIRSVLAEAGSGLKAGGAKFIVLAANSIHQVSDAISAESGLDLLHIADPVGSEIAADGFGKVGLLGTRATMETDVYSHRLERTFGISTIIPEREDRVQLDQIIYTELSAGVIRPGLQTYLNDLIRKLSDRGADAIILGCPELTLMVPPDSDTIPAYDTTRLHARAAVRRSIEEYYV